MSAPQIVTKAEFAAICRVSASRVSHWIADGKMGGPALVGIGRAAKINVAVALAQLRNSIDVSQRLGLNGLTKKLGEERAPAAPEPQSTPAPRAEEPPIVDTVESGIKAEKFRQAQLKTRRDEEEEHVRRGRYVDAAEAKAGYNRVAAELVGGFESWLSTLADAFAAKFQIPARDALHLARLEFRSYRGRASERYAAEAAVQPDTVELADEMALT